MFIEIIDTPVGELSIEAYASEIKEIHWGRLSCKEAPNEITMACKKQLNEYFLGKRKVFDLPLAINGTSFQKLVWEELLRIEFGKTLSYSQMAINIGRPKAQRAVGGANHVNKFPIVIPCHRVIGKDQKLVGFAPGVDKKAWLLSHEKKLAL